ncbi:TetR/AcrR family transcriptional regulator [Cellulomonas sp. NPDC089187]|uniref:TetR/AcrR family transcriptional regulator n=1 Tax=Cellulomonas sp. NPDC089187 TaxID=3154970 RepID=UPI003420E340
MQEVDEGLRARKKRARLEALVDATHRLADQHGLEHVTVEAISAEAGCSVRTFFNYFESKDDAVLGLTPWHFDPEAAEVFADGGPTGDLLADLQELVRVILDHPPLGKQRMARAFDLAKGHPELLVRAYSLIQQHHEDTADLIRRRLGHECDEATTQLVGALLMSLAHSTFVRWDSAGQHGEVQEYLPSVVSDLAGILTTRAPA